MQNTDTDIRIVDGGALTAMQAIRVMSDAMKTINLERNIVAGNFSGQNLPIFEGLEVKLSVKFGGNKLRTPKKAKEKN